MNMTSFIYSVLLVYVAIVIYDYLLHHVALKAMYDNIAAIWRKRMLLSPMYLSQLLFAVVFVLLFNLNYQHAGLSEGFGYGACIGLLLAALDLGVYSYLPVPFMLIFWCMLAETIKCIGLGLITAMVYSMV